MKIYLVGKDIYSIGITETAIKNANLAMMVYDDNNAVQNYTFEQTESLTENLCGITDYGLLTFNTNNTDVNNEVVIRAVNGGDVVEKICKIRCLMKTEVGNEIATKCGEGDKYKAGYGIEIDDEEKEISIDLNVVATRDDIEHLEETKQENLVSGQNIKTINGLSVLGEGNIDTGFVATYQETTAQEILEYIDQFPDRISSVIVKRGNDYYSTILAVKQGDNKVLLRCIGSASGSYYIFNYTVTDGTWASNSQGLQNLLVSGENIKTVNNQSLLGSGNIDIQGGGGEVFVAYIEKPEGEVPITTDYQAVYDAVTSGKIVLIEDYSLREYAVGEQADRMCPFAVKVYSNNIVFYCLSPISTMLEGYDFDSVRIYRVTELAP